MPSMAKFPLVLALSSWACLGLCSSLWLEPPKCEDKPQLDDDGLPTGS